MADSGKIYVNKCPNCGAYFACDTCPICKTPFPVNERQTKPLHTSPTAHSNDTKKKEIPAKESPAKDILDLLKAFGVLVLFAVLGVGLALFSMYDNVDTPSVSTSRPTEVFPQNGNFEVISPCIRSAYFSFTNQRSDCLYIRFKSEDGNTTLFEICMWPDSTAEFTVPSGKYMVCYAIGNLTDDFKWYGKNDRFVGGTSYYVDTMTIPPNGLQFTLAKGSSISGGVSQSSKSTFD